MPEETQAAAEQQETKPTAGATEAKAEQASAGSFTQEQVNKFTGSARDEGRKSGVNDLLQKVKLQSVEELTSILENYRKSEADKLSESEKVAKQLKETADALEQLKRENEELKLRQSVASTAKELNLEFVNEQASSDAFLILPKYMETEKEIKAAFKKMHEERSYLFKSVEKPELDSTKKSKSDGNVLTDDRREAIKKKYHIK